jgi:hypothetical protein
MVAPCSPNNPINTPSVENIESTFGFSHLPRLPRHASRKMALPNWVAAVILVGLLAALGGGMVVM